MQVFRSLGRLTLSVAGATMIAGCSNDSTSSNALPLTTLEAQTGFQTVPGNANLLFDVELVSIP